MEKIFKKSLALMVSAALCLTAFVGCLTVNAETAGSATVTVGEVTAKTTDTTVVVPVTIAAGADATTGIAAAIFDITVDSAKFDFSKRHWDSCLTYNTAQNIHVSTITNGDFIQPLNGTNNTYRFLVEGLAEGSTDENTLGTFTSATFNLTFDVIDNTAGETAITFNTATIAPQACNAGTLDLQGKYTGDEKPFIVTTAAGKITVQAEQPACKHVWKFVSAIPATADAEGSITLKCSACEETKTETVSYNAYNTVAQFSAACESQIVLQYDVWTSLFKENSDITTTIFVFEKDDYSDGALTTATTVLTPADAVEFTAQGKTAYRFSLGVAAKMLNDTCKATVYCQADGVWYNGMVNTKTFVDFANNQLGSASTADSLKTLFVDLLNYGSSAQAAFNYNADNLANAGIDAYQNYATQTDPEATNVKNATYTLEAGKFIPASYSVMAESNVQIRYSFMPYQYTPVADNVRIHFEYTDYLGTAKSIDYYSYDKLVADGNTDKIAAGEYFTVTGGRYYVDFDKLAAADCDVKITATIFDGDRPTEPDAIVDYSIGSFVAIERVNGSTNLTFINNMYKYCKSALTYFTTK